MYLSIVVCGRNDNYGGNFLSRCHVFVSSISILSNRYNVESEIIFVEWNPLSNTATLHEELTKNKAAIEYKQKMRFISVPNHIHNKFKNRQPHLPVLDYVGKNVGIRRSRGRFILVCSPDIIFQDALFDMMKNNLLEDKYIYRTTRADVTRGKIVPNNYEEHQKLLLDCSQSITATHLDVPSHVYDNTVGNRIEVSHMCRNGCGDFLLMAKDNWFRLKGCPETGFSQRFMHLDSMTLTFAVKYFEQWMLSKNFTIYHQDHDRSHNQPDYDPQPSEYINDDDWGLRDYNLEEKINW